MKLFSYDAYNSMTRFLPVDEPLVFVDVGANEGQTVHRILTEFPLATVHAFEPAPSTFKLLERNTAGERRVRIYPTACGSSVGTVPFHVTDNHWCSSVLKPSELGQRYYGNWYRTREVVNVPLVTLDAWSRDNQVPCVDVLKVDAQGYDLEVLRGAVTLLASGVRAINCECQFAAEYEGCATFSQIDRFLVDRGYALHQLHEVNERGDEEQTTYADGLWLRADVLEQLRSRVDLPDLSPIGRVRSALRTASRGGARCAALYGSGKHTQGIAERLAGLAVPVVAIIDDNPNVQGSSIAGIEIIAPIQAFARGVDVVVLSSDAHEAELWRRSAKLRAQGIRVMPLYNPKLAETPETAIPQPVRASVPAHV